MQLRRAGLLAAMALLAVSCGGDGDSGDADGVAAPATAPSTATTATVAPPAAAEVEIPDAVLTDVTSGEEMSLRSFVPSERPVLFWFWAPH